MMFEDHGDGLLHEPEGYSWDGGLSLNFIHKKIGSFFKGAAPVIGGAIGGAFGPLGALAGQKLGSAIRGGGDSPGGPAEVGGGGIGGFLGDIFGSQDPVGGFLSGLDFSRLNEQRSDLQDRSAQDFQARLPLQDAFLQSFVNQNQLQAPDLSSMFATENPFSRPAGPVGFGGPQGPPVGPQGPVEAGPVPPGPRPARGRPQDPESLAQLIQELDRVSPLGRPREPGQVNERRPLL